MAFFARHFSSFLLLVLLSSLHANARDSQFFSKVPTTTVTTTAAAQNSNAQETVEVPSKELPLEPNFVQDAQNGYGLYGHETGLLPPSTTTNLPHKAESGEFFTTPTTKNYYYNQNAYVNDPQGASETRFTDIGYTNSNPNNYYYYNNNINNNKDAYVTDPQGTRYMTRGYTNPAAGAANNYYYNGGNRYNTQQEGMSDTRFLENGRYYYDIHSEGNYPNRYQNSRGVVYSNNGYNGQNGEMYEEFQEDSPEEYVP